MRLLVISVIFAVLLLSISVNESYGYNQKRAKMIFLGDMHTEIPESLRLDFTTYSLDDQKITSTIKARIGLIPVTLTGSGAVDVHYKDGDRQCKSVLGAQKMFSEDGKDGFEMIFKGKACHMGQGYKIFSGTFYGSEPTGIFADKIIEGSLSGSMDYSEQNWNLKLRSIILFDAQ